MHFIQKIASLAFDDEMSKLMKTVGIDNIIDNKAAFRELKDKPLSPGTSVGKTDEYNPTETEADHGQQL